MAFELVGFDPTEPAGFARALAAPPRAAVRMALVHQPEHVTRLGPAGFDLVIAGHTHGGQIVLPGIGPLVTLSPLPDAIDAGGLHRHSGTQLVVSRGIGCEAGFAPPLRLFCSPEVTLVTVRGTAARSPVEEGAR
jgi:predicted MPP superfamily phosphohydrolase